MKTPIDAFLAVLEIGGTLAPVDGDRLRVALPRDCPHELKEAIHAHKPGLLALLSGPPFIVVRSEILPPPLLFWTADDNGRELLLSLGAASGSVYAFDELRAIVERNPDAESLKVLHRCKQTFGGSVFAPRGAATREHFSRNKACESSSVCYSYYRKEQRR